MYDAVCSSSQQVCVKDVKAQSTTKCFPNCDGVLVASFTKTENLNNAEYVAPKLFEQYNNYSCCTEQQFVQFPAKIKSISVVTITVIVLSID